MGRLKASTINGVAIGTISSGTSVSTTLTLAGHVVDAGSNRKLVVLIGVHQGTITAVTYGGVALTKVGAGRSDHNESGEEWELVAPSIGSADVIITRSGGSWTGAKAISLTNVEQSLSTNFGTTSSNTDTASISGNVTLLSAYNLVLCAVGCEGVPTIGGVGTSFGNLQGQSFEDFASAYYQAQGTDQVTISFTQSPLKRYGMVMVALVPASITETQLRSAAGSRTAAGTRTLAPI